MMKRLSDVIRIERITQSDKITLIPAKVGTGKTYWVGEKLSKNNKVLYLCALRSLANQAIYDYENPNLKVMTFYEFVKGELNNKCNYEELDQIGKIYDYIVIDEAHDLVSFSDFMEDIYFIRELCMRHKKKIILLSATPESLQLCYGNKEFDLIEEVVNLETEAKPKNFKLTNDRKKVIEDIKLMSKRNKVVFYTDTVVKALNLEKELLDFGVKAVAVVGDSSEKGKKAMKDEKRKGALRNIEKGQFPSECNVLITTTKLREGINFKDKNIKLVITEILDIISLVQISGRVRDGVDTMIGIIPKKIKEEVIEMNIFKFVDESKNRLIREADIVNQLYHSDKAKYEVAQRVILNGLTKEKFIRYNEFTDNIEFDRERFWENRLKKLSYKTMYQNPESFIEKIIGVKPEIINSEEETKKQVEELIEEYKGSLYIYGKEKKEKLKHILGVNSQQKVFSELLKLGYEVEKIPEKKFWGIRKFNFYHFKGDVGKIEE